MTEPANGLYRTTLGLLVVYILLTFYSVMSLLTPLPRIPGLTPFLTLIAFAFAVLHAGQRWGWARAGLLVGLCFVISLLFESVGVATGLVYGPYHYTSSLGPKFLGLVPFLIPLAWFMMMYPSLVIAQALARTHGKDGRPGPIPVLAASALGGLVMTAWDLAMDPMMVQAGHWVWDGAPATRLYFGIPLQNYWGWWLTTFITFALFISLAPLVRSKVKVWPVQPEPVFDRLVVYSYIASGLGTIFTAFIIGLDGPAMVGLFAMIPWAWLGWQRLSEPGAVLI